MTYRLEVKKDGMRQTQDGTWKLTLTVHPNDMPDELLRAPMGQRCYVDLRLLGDFDETPAGDEEAFKRLVETAGRLCKARSFQRFMLGKIGMHHMSSAINREELTAEALRGYLFVKSRKELMTNARARYLFEQLMAEYRKDGGFTKP